MIDLMDIITWIKISASPSTDPESPDTNSALLCVAFNKQEKTFFQRTLENKGWETDPV